MLFTTLKIKAGRPLALKCHLEILRNHFYDLTHSYPKLDVEDIFEAIKNSCDKESIYRFNIVLDLEGKVSYKCNPYLESNRENSQLKIYPSSFVSEAPQFKTYPSSRVPLLEEAHNACVDDWIFYTDEKWVLETSVANLFWIEDKTLYTPCPKLPLYYGATLQLVVEAAKSLGYKVQKVTFPLSELQNISEVYMCNSMKGIVPISKIEDKQLMLNPFFLESLRNRYEEISFQEDAFLTTI